MNYLVLKQRIYLVISVLTLIVLGSGYGSCTKFSDIYASLRFKVILSTT